MPEYIQAALDLEGFETEETQKEDTGSRITPSSLETIIHYNFQYKRLQEKEKLTGDALETTFLAMLNSNKPFKEDKEVKNARDTIRGTHLHNLTYVNSLFYRASVFNKLPELEDIKTAFPFRDKDYYEGLLRILALQDPISEDPLDNAQNFWNTWRFNGQDFLPKGRRYRISAKEIQKLWEKDLIEPGIFNLTRESFIEKQDNIDPTKTLVMNEVPLILNTYFPETNIQICTNIDEIRITPSSDTPIHIIDYKTGREFYKERGFEENLQVFLMVLAVFTKFADEIYELDIQTSDWDLRYPKEQTNKKPLSFKNKNMLSKRKNVKSIEHWQIPNLPFKDFIKFSYVDPVTQEENEMDLKQVGLADEDGIRRNLKILEYYHDFYLQYKHKGMRDKINGSTGFYTLPDFPSKEFLQKNIGFWDNSSKYFME